MDKPIDAVIIFNCGVRESSTAPNADLICTFCTADMGTGVIFRYNNTIYDSVTISKNTFTVTKPWNQGYIYQYIAFFK